MKTSKTNKYISLVVVIIVVALTSIVTYVIAKPNKEEDPGIVYRQKYPLINPSRRLESSENLVTNIQPIREYLKSLPEQHKDWAEMSIYFEVLKTGSNVTVNPDLKIWPASLAKLPVAMATMKKVESEDWDLDTMIKLEEEDADTVGNPGIEKEIGRSYDVKFLLERLLLQSDNTAYRMLTKNFTKNEINEISEEVGLEELLVQGGKISAKDYTRLLRVLYTASYINEEHSQFLLELMQESEFKNFIRAGLPPETPFSHKWGTNIAFQVYSDSGIVYVENRPYMISVMIQGKSDDQEENELKSNALMKEIGQKTYEYINSY